MANKKISELTSGTPATSSVIPVSDAAGTVTNKITVQSIFDLDARWNVFKPGAPSIVSVTAGNAQVVLEYAPDTIITLLSQTPITDYSVQYSTNSGSTWTTFSRAATTDLTATVTGLYNGTAYLFRVAAVNGVGTGPYATASSAVTPATVPGAPTSVTASAGIAQASLSWTAPSTGGSAITDYIVEYSSDSGTNWSTFSDGTSTTASATVTGLTNGTAYIFRVSAVNAIGTGSVSSSTSPVTPSASTAPGAPTSLSATAGAAQLALSWTAPASDGGSAITGYSVQYTPAGGSATTVSTGSTSTSYTLTGLTNGTAYTVAVAAVNAIGTGTYSSTTSGTPVTVPGAPTGVAGTSGDAQVALTWTAPSSTGGSAITDYTVQYSSNSGSTWTTFSRSASTTASATVTGLTNGTAYTFQVRAINAAGNGSYSSASSAVTPAAAAELALTQSAGVTWTGSGSAASKYAYAGNISQSAISNVTTGLKFTPAAAGIFNFKTNFLDAADDNNVLLRIYRGATLIYSGQHNGGANLNLQLDASTANAAITFNISNDSGYEIAYFSNTEVWLSPYVVPLAPTGLSVNPGSTHLDIRWTAPAEPVGKPITGYAVEYTPAGGSATLVALASTARSYIADNLTNGTSYSVRVRAINAIGDGAFTSSVSGTPFSGASLALTRTAGGTWTGTGVSGSAYTCSASLNQSVVAGGAAPLRFTALQRGTFYFTSAYKDPNDDNTSRVRIYKNGASIYVQDINGDTTISQNFILTYGDFITFGAEYDAGPNQNYTNTQAYLDAYPVISDPTNLSVTGGNGQASLSWTAPSTNANLITDYVIQYSMDGGTVWLTWAHTASTSSSATVTGLYNGVSHLFRIKAIGTFANDSQFVASTAVTPSGAANGSAINEFYILNYTSGTWTGSGSAASPFASSSVFSGSGTATYLPFKFYALVDCEISVSMLQTATYDDNHGSQTVYYHINSANVPMTQISTDAATSTPARTMFLFAGETLNIYVAGGNTYNNTTDNYRNISVSGVALRSSPLEIFQKPASIGTWTGTGTVADPFTAPATLTYNMYNPANFNFMRFRSIRSGTISLSASIQNIPDDNTSEVSFYAESPNQVFGNTISGTVIAEGASGTRTMAMQRHRIYLLYFVGGNEIYNLKAWGAT